MKAEEKTRRPRLAGNRLSELLDIAAEVFIADGFEGASTNLIAQRASASKASLYLLFPTKDDLFLAVLEHRMNRIFQAVAGTIPAEAPTREALVAFATQFLQLVFNDAQTALFRVVSRETGRFPQLGSRFFELGPGRGLSVLSGYLKAQIEQGALRAEDPEVIAQLFLGMISGLPLLRGMLGITSHLKTAAQRSQHVDSAVDAFILAFKVEPNSRRLRRGLSRPK